MSQYRVTIGNTTPQKGHKSHCAHLALTFTVDASNPREALIGAKAQYAALLASLPPSVSLDILWDRTDEQKRAKLPCGVTTRDVVAL